jgi:hypothetical protein
LEAGVHYSAVTTTQTDTGIYPNNQLHFVQMTFTSFTILDNGSFNELMSISEYVLKRNDNAFIGSCNETAAGFWNTHLAI